MAVSASPDASARAGGAGTVAVVGGGISGLTLAYRLMRAGRDVVCLEPSARPGGMIRSERRDGYLCEHGPDAIVDGVPDTAQLIDDVGLGSETVRATAAAKRRLVYLGGRLRAVPSDPFALLSSDLLSTQGKWRLMREPWVRPRAANTDNSDTDESVLAFGERRLGLEAAHRLLAPATIGIFAGDAARLSLQSAFPRLHALETQHGSLLRGLRAIRKEGASPGRAFSFRDGLESLPRALAARLGPRLRTARVEAIVRVGQRWTLSIDMGQPPVAADTLVLACPTEVAAELLAPLAPVAAEALRPIARVPVAIVLFGFAAAPAGIDLGVYGFLVARGEGLQMLGCQYESSVFPGRAPAGGTLLRVLLGGAFHPEVLAEDDASLIARVRAELRTATGLTAPPDFTAIVRVPAAIPQYEIGHAGRLARADAALGALPDLHLLGYGLRGVGINDCIRSATALARRLAEPATANGGHA